MKAAPSISKYASQSVLKFHELHFLITFFISADVVYLVCAISFPLYLYFIYSLNAFFLNLDDVERIST